MELNWSTFLLEIFNFLVLVWILKRFLYRPVTEALEKRREKIELSLSEAESHHAQAIALEQEYKNRLNDWALEKQQLREKLLEEIQTEKAQKLEQLQTELEREREKAAVIDSHHQADAIKQMQKNAHQQAARFASKLLKGVASEALEAGLFELLIKTFEELDESTKKILRKACNASSDSITLSSAYDLSAVKKQQLEQTIAALAERPMNVNYIQDSSLIAGFRITIGAWVLGINLQDELLGFAELVEKTE